MAFAEGRPLVQRPDILSADVEGEVVIFDPASGRAHLLSHSGSLLWPAFSSPVTVSELALDVAEVFDLPLSEATSQVRTFCEQLLETGALQPADAVDTTT